MKQGTTHTYALAALFMLAAALCISSTLADCNVCSTVSGTACINSTAFNPCDANNKPITASVVVCPAGYFCTARGMKCINLESEMACPDSEAAAGCGCSGINDVIACTSRDAFVICNSGVATTQVGTCPTGYVCNTAPIPKKVCVAADCYAPTCDKAPAV